MIVAFWKKLCLLVLCISCMMHAFSQHSDTTKKGNHTDTIRVDTIRPDTARPNFILGLQKKGQEITKRNIEKYKASKLSIKQEYLIEEIQSTTQRAKIFLKKRIDSASVSKELEDAKASFNIANEGVFLNTGTIQTQGNLAASTAILTELLRTMTDQKNDLEEYSEDLIGFRDKIDSLSSDSALYTAPSDSAAAVKYIQKVLIVAKEIGPTDSAMDQSISASRDLQTEVEVMIFKLRSSLEDVERFRNNLTSRGFSREVSNITGPIEFSRPLTEIIQFSLAKERLALNFYVKENQGKIVLLIVLIIIAYIFMRFIRKKMVGETHLEPEYKIQQSIRFPILSSIVIISSIFQFIFIDPPYIFQFCLWMVSVISLTIVINSYVTKYWLRFWLITILFFVLASLENMILQASRTERWIIWLLAFSGILYYSYILLRGRRLELKEKKLLYFIGFVVFSEIGSLVFNTFGRYNVSKTLLISGYSGIVVAVLFLWTIRLINEVLGLISKVYRHTDIKLFYINFDKIGDRVPVPFYVFLVFGWVILVGRNFYSFKQFVSDFNNFLMTERNIGNYTFTINGLFVFILILAFSVVLSKIISFFAEPVDTMQKDSKPGKVGIGSWLLLIRILIITLGLFIAFAAAGIPMDRITIIIGALGVGIGLGLQGLVNNLVSGLIIAFEKPVNVGDNIEINNKPGVMKSIGFRSSVVTLIDGASLIIPNGDLLSQHLINWSMGRNIKRLTLGVGVAYGSDLAKVQKILSKILDEDKRVRQYPLPIVSAKAFGPSSIDFELLFWVSHIGISIEVKTDILLKINAIFETEHITIPFPQQELHIKTIPIATGKPEEDQKPPAADPK